MGVPCEKPAERAARHFTEMCSGSEAGSYLRLRDSCITQLKAQGPFRTCNESKEEEEVQWIAIRQKKTMMMMMGVPHERPVERAALIDSELVGRGTTLIDSGLIERGTTRDTYLESYITKYTRWGYPAISQQSVQPVPHLYRPPPLP